jgi:NifB/MoaA-like Fe-S oxidoreductase
MSDIPIDYTEEGLQQLKLAAASLKTEGLAQAEAGVSSFRGKLNECSTELSSVTREIDETRKATIQANEALNKSTAFADKIK